MRPHGIWTLPHPVAGQRNPMSESPERGKRMGSRWYLDAPLVPEYHRRAIAVSYSSLLGLSLRWQQHVEEETTTTRSTRCVWSRGRSGGLQCEKCATWQRWPDAEMADVPRKIRAKSRNCAPRRGIDEGVDTQQAPTRSASGNPLLASRGVGYVA